MQQAKNRIWLDIGARIVVQPILVGIGLDVASVLMSEIYLKCSLAIMERCTSILLCTSLRQGFLSRTCPAIVDLPDGVSVRCNLVDIEPDPKKIEFGMPVEMVTRKVRERTEKNAEGVEETIDIIAFFFKPSQN